MHEKDSGITGVEARYQNELNAGRFVIQRCTDCHRCLYYPREVCSNCGSASLAWITPKGTGTIYSVTTVRRKPSEGGDINVSLVELDEGVRLMSKVCNLPPDRVRIGQSVQARVEIVGGKGLLVFDACERSVS